MKQTASYPKNQCWYKLSVHPMMRGSHQKETQISDANTYLLQNSDLSIRLFSSIYDVPPEWDKLIEGKNLFQNRKYLEVVEAHPPQNLDFIYVLFYRGKVPIGLNVCQIVNFSAEDSLNEQKSPQKSNFFSRIGQRLRKALTKRLHFKLLVSGSMLLTGEHGFYFDPEQLAPLESYQILEKSMFSVRKHLKKNGASIAGFMIKDITPEHRSLTKDWTADACCEIVFQPNMILELRENWNEFDDYLNAMSSKYRVRVRRARKKGKKLERREMGVEAISEYLDQINDLYREIANKAGFNVMELNEQYFLQLKKELTDNFQLFGYFIDEEFIGFNTAIYNGEELEAHFLGFSEKNNHPNQLYLNMLYDIIELSLQKEGVQRVVFARTAMEIKSSVGAEAQDLYCYFRHPIRIVNRFFPAAVNYLEPKVEWQARHPFKDSTPKEGKEA